MTIFAEFYDSTPIIKETMGYCTVFDLAIMVGKSSKLSRKHFKCLLHHYFLAKKLHCECLTGF